MQTETVKKSMDMSDYQPNEKREILLGEAFALKPGEMIEMVSNADPEPILYELSVKAGDQYVWSYTMKGPQKWKFLVQRALNKKSNTSGGCCNCCCGG